MSGHRSLGYLASTLLLLSGCTFSTLDTPLARAIAFPFLDPPGCRSTTNDENSWSLYLIDEQTQEPLANVEIVRLNPIPNPGSIWSMIKYGEDDFIRTKITQTDAQGNARIFKSKGLALEAMLDTSRLRFDFEQQQATYTPVTLLGPLDPQTLSMTLIQPNLIVVRVPRFQSE